MRKQGVKMKKVIILMLFLTGIAVFSAELPNKSVYTSIKDRECKRPSGSFRKIYPYEEDNTAVECSGQKNYRIFKVFHTSEQIVDELCTIVDLGGTVEDVFVHHKIYGQLQAPLHISSRRDVQLFLEELKSGKSTPLKDVTSGYHYHTVSADSGETLDLIGQELGKKGYLCQ